jgi:hypothetical protein
MEVMAKHPVYQTVERFLRAKLLPAAGGGNYNDSNNKNNKQSQQSQQSQSSSQSSSLPRWGCTS